MTIDLHLPNGICDERYILKAQLDYFEKELDNALVLGLSEITVIHGIGEGVLKGAVHKLSKEHPHVKSYVNEYHPLYGFGSTKIIFK